jgi:hypothetical protein
MRSEFAARVAIALSCLLAWSVQAQAGQPSRTPAAASERATAICGPGDRPETGMQGETPLTDMASGRSLSPYFCGMRVVSKLEVFNSGQHGFLKRSRTCAYVSGSGSNGRGLAVVDVSDPKAPKVVGLLTDPGARGTSETMDVIDVGDRHLLIAGDYSGGLRPPGPSPLDIYDITDCAKPKHLTTFWWPANIHVPKITPDGKRVYAGREYGTDGVLVLDISDPASPKYMGEFPLVLPGGRGQRCHDMWMNEAETRLYCAGSVPTIENRKDDSAPSIWDISQVGKPNPTWPTIRFVGTSTTRGQGDHHIPLAVINGTPYVVGANELRCSAYPRIFDISDETNLRAVGEFKLEATDRCLSDPDWAKANASGNYGLHYNDVVDNAWGHIPLGMFNFMGSGVRIVDLRDPMKPREVAYYHPAGITAPIADRVNGKIATDSCMSHDYFVPETKQFWFVCRSGFYVAELSPAVKTYLGAPK